MKKTKFICGLIVALLCLSFLGSCDFTQKNKQPKIGVLYNLQEAYDLGLLNYGDLYDISFYHDGVGAIYAPISRAPFPKNPEFLSAKTENKIKQTFLDDYNYDGDYPIEYTINDITITNYCGTYNGVVVVMIEGLYCYDEGFISETVACITFNYSSRNKLRVWTEIDSAGWKAIAEATIAETMKFDANFKITAQSLGNTYGEMPQVITVDGNKIKNDNNVFSYNAKYLHFDNGVIWWYMDNKDIWYKSPQVSVGDNAPPDAPFQSLWRMQVNDSILSVLPDTLADLQNVKYKGNNKYTYRFVAESGPDVEGWNPVFDYTFITDGTKITEVQLRGKSHKITYGGQSVTLPNAIEPTKLLAPQNLKIVDGILSWDTVEGAENPWKTMEGSGKYYIEIHRGNTYIAAAYVETEFYDLCTRLMSQDWIANGTYEITVKAYPPIFLLTYQSDKSVPISYEFVR
jgi:hypothetical protein